MLEEAPPAGPFPGPPYPFGRWRRPIADPRFPAGRLRRLRLKEWHYVSAATPDHFLGLAVLHLRYAAAHFVYLVERASGGKLESGAQALPGTLRFAPSSTHGETLWRRGADAATIRRGAGGGFEVELDLPLGAERLTGAFRLDDSRTDSLALLFPLAPDRPAYVHKIAGVPVEGTLALGERRIELSGGLGASDWTRSFARRDTRWKWASLAARSTAGGIVGLNLSAEVYDDAAGASQENALWVDGRVHLLGPVRFEVPARPAAEPWRIRSPSGGEVDLRFEPAGARAEERNLGLVRSRFVQPYGTFTGRIRSAGAAAVELEQAFGVVEDHRSVW